MNYYLQCLLPTFPVIDNHTPSEDAGFVHTTGEMLHDNYTRCIGKHPMINVLPASKVRRTFTK